jgi:hypothetical protein
MRLVTVILTMIFLGNGAARSEETLYQTHFSNMGDRVPCYSRTYDETHLKAHPKQTVKRIVLGLNALKQTQEPNTPANFELSFGFQRIGSEEWFAANAYCKPSAAQEVKCGLEGDGGMFTLKASKDGDLRLETGSYGIMIEGEKGFAELSASKGDDRVFLLRLDCGETCHAVRFDSEQAE